MSQPVIAGLLSLVIVWEAFKIAVAWRQQASVWAGQRFSRANDPKAFWGLLSLHLILFGMMLVVLTDLLFGWIA